MDPLSIILKLVEFAATKGEQISRGTVCEFCKLNGIEPPPEDAEQELHDDFKKKVEDKFGPG